jgi:peptidoglycan hydrolase-like protein with peptidoglycan-binding domain
MPGYTTDENGNVVKAGDPNFVEPATQKLAQQGRQAAKEKEYAASADQADADMGAAMTANAAAASPTAADRDDAEMGAAMTANAQAATQAANGVNAQGQNVGLPVSDETGAVNPNIKKNPETGELYSTAPATAAPATAAPAAPAARSKSDPKVKALQDKLIAAGAKIKADGIMGPATQAAMRQFPRVAGQGAKPATALPGRAVPGGGQISDTPMAESVYQNDELSRIISLVHHR